MNPLVPCPNCDRHVRASEAACPFCDSALPTDLASRAVPPATRRMSRGAAFTFAATIAIASASVSTEACGGVVEGGGGDDHGGGQTEYGAPVFDDGGTAAMYGLAIHDSGTASDGGAPADDGGIAAMYGIAYLDGGSPPDDDGGLVAAYGLPSPPPDH